MTDVDARRQQARAALHGRQFRLLLICALTGLTGYTALLPVVPLWATRSGGGPIAAGSTTAVFMAATVLTQLGVPVMLRYVSHRALLSGGCVLLGLPSFGYIAAQNMPALLGVSAVRGAGFGLLVVLSGAMVAELLPESARGRGTAWYGATSGLSTVLFLPSGTWAAEQWGFAVVFLVAGLLPLLAAVVGWGIGPLPTAEQDPRTNVGDGVAPGRDAGAGADDDTGTEVRGGAGAGSDRAGQWSIRSVRPLLIPAIAMLAGAVNSAIVLTFVADAFAPWLASVALLLFGIAVTSGRLVAGMLRDRAGEPRMLLPGHGCVLLGAALLAAAAGGIAVVPGVLLGSAAVAFGFGSVQNDAMVSMFGRVRSSEYAVASTVWNISYDGGTGLGSIGIGAIAVGGYPVAFGCAALFGVLLSPAAIHTARARRSV